MCLETNRKNVKWNRSPLQETLETWSILLSSAAIQNILIGATQKGFPNYWSSGGVLRQKPARRLLSVPLEEMLLGCLFIFPKDAYERGVEIKAGKLHKEGKNIQTWSKSVTL